ncbi:MAG: hypothetical protein ACKVP7_09310 [Hyphomicrobiaceae bacterium]
MTTLPRRSANLLLALSLFPASSFPAWLGVGRSVGEMSRVGGFAPETPAGYAFSIWGLIFSMWLIYAVRQALPAYRNHELYARIGWATAGASLLNSLWMILAQTIGNGWWLVIIIWAILACALVAFFRTLAMRDQLDTFDRWIVLPMTGVLSAWLSAAVWLNLSSYIRQIDPSRLGLTTTAFALVVLACATAFSWAVLAKARGNVFYGLTTLWALVGIIVANSTNAAGQRSVVWAACGVAIVTIGLMAWFRQTTGPTKAP